MIRLALDGPPCASVSSDYTRMRVEANYRHSDPALKMTSGEILGVHSNFLRLIQEDCNELAH
jgi:hypothetical protein